MPVFALTPESECIEGGRGGEGRGGEGEQGEREGGDFLQSRNTACNTLGTRSLS